MVGLFVTVGILFIFSGFCNAVMDTLVHHFDKSIFKDKSIWWNPEESWKLKYKDDLKTPRFPGSTSLFVFTTDAWHFFKTTMFTVIPIAFSVLIFTHSHYDVNDWIVFAYMPSFKILFSSSFHVFYTWVFPKK